MTPGSARDDTSSAGRHTSSAISDKLARNDGKPETMSSAMMADWSWLVVLVLVPVVR